MPIYYLRGDATQPVNRPAAIFHVCNDIGAWGAGFVMAISSRWKAPERAYRHFANMPGGLELGTYQLTAVEPGLLVVNLIAQRGLRSKTNPRPLNYVHLGNALMNAGHYLNSNYGGQYTIHMPRIGCGLAGGDWRIVEQIIHDALPNFDIWVYDL